MNIGPIHELARGWRDEAERLRRYSEPAANAWEDAASELEAAFARWEIEALTLSEGEAESGYSRATLERMLSDGKIENAGESGAPRVRRCDLPRKPGRGTGLALANGDLADEILTRRERGR